MAQSPEGPTAVIAQQMRELRRGRGWSAQRLAEAMTSEGIAWDRSIVTNLEIGRRQQVSVQEWLCLARVLGVEPLDLLIPDDGKYQVTPATSLAAAEVRAWIRGADPGAQDEVGKAVAALEQERARLAETVDSLREILPGGGSMLFSPGKPVQFQPTPEAE